MRTTCQYFEDETVRLDDGDDLRNAIMRRCKLIYAGGPLRIDGALFYDCSIAFEGDGEHAATLLTTIYRSFYADGVRTLRLNADGSYATA